MTEQPDESLNPTPVPNDGSSSGPENSLEQPTPPAETPTESAPNGTGEDGLPEWEPLTPELVEDEAIRGDFVIRWVVVGLALLLGLSQIGETRTLLHVKNGQYLLGHGFLPGSKDVFSYTASDRRWVNLSWLFDIASASVYSIGGGIGLSLLQGVLVGLAFGLLVHTANSQIRTWWGSICSVLALLACYPQFTVQPELVTLLGISFLLWSLVRAEELRQPQRLWVLVPTIWLWAQLDQRAWFGWLLLLLWTAGQSFSRETSAADKSVLLKVSLASLFVVVIHPFLWESWLAPVRMYLTDYPAMRFAYPQPSATDQVFFPIWREFLWVSIHHRTIAALVLFGATLVTLILNRPHVRLSHVLVFAGFNALSLFATHELAAASLVNCVVCTLNAQAWYRERFGQVYSIDWRELLFSRGGRAVTVMSFFALAWLVLSGRLDGPGKKRTGLGFEANLASAMSDYEQFESPSPKIGSDDQTKLKKPIDDRPFHASVRQGDLMIWGGEKTFVDSRTGLFYGSGSGDDNLIALHLKVRRALQPKQERVPGSGEPDIWKAVFAKYKIQQMLIRLNAPMPDYASFRDALASSDFELNDLNASLAVFLRNDPTNTEVAAYVKEYPFDPLTKAFREPAKIEDPTREWSKPATAYENLFSLRRPIVPNGVQAAQHYLQLAATGGSPSSLRAACALLAIRHANEGLRSDPNSAEGYQALGVTYFVLGQLESAILSQGKQPIPITLRYYQSVAALHQALALQPDDSRPIQQLLQQYQQMGRTDMQLDLFRKWKRLIPLSRSMTAEQRKEREGINEAIVQLEEVVSRIDSMVAKHLSDGADPFQVAVGAFQAGGLLRAIKTLEQDAVYLEKNPQAKLVLASWLMEAGRGRDAAQIFESLEGLAGEGVLGQSRDAAAISAMTLANYQSAIRLWGQQKDSAMASLMPQVAFTLPFLTLNPMWISPDVYPSSGVGATAQVMQEIRIDGAMTLCKILQAQLEGGATKEAGEAVHLALQLDPRSQWRPLLRFYLECLTGEQVELELPEPEAEEYPDLTAPEEPVDAKTEPKADLKLEKAPEEKTPDK